MDADKKYITGITRADLKEIAAACNSYGGPGIDVYLTEQGLKFEVDRQQLTRWVKEIMEGRSI